MAQDNSFISDQFDLLAKLMDIHGENSFKVKSYANAAFTIDKLPVQLSTLPEKEIFAVKGIGESVGKKVIELLQTGKIAALEELIQKTPEGILEMLTIKGIGPKKIATIWREMEIETLGELLYACNENRLLLYKGFGEKTQKSVKEAIEFYMKSQGSYLYSEAEVLVDIIQEKFKEHFKDHLFAPVGAFREQMEIIDKLEWLTTATQEELAAYTVATDGLPLSFITIEKNDFDKVLQETVSPALFEGVIQPGDIKGIIHSHSNWSDGRNTIEEMAKACIAQGFEYLVISDHSKSAFYAHGLKEEQIVEQHAYVDTLNKQLAPFKIFKSIESDILNDGSLDYSDAVLASFDLVIASVHSNLKMSEEKAMIRLIKAIENPYTTILGHMTGRLLLSRAGYPVDHKKIIDACVANNVVIELNAHPRRLDIDWRWIPYALERGALLSIDPDAHNIEGFKDVKYGVLSAQKGKLTKDKNLSSFSLAEFEHFLRMRNRK